MRQRTSAVAVVGILAIAFFSWVGIADGPDSPRVRFYPDKTEIGPGETLVWTIEVLDESILPLTVRPEFNNDKSREPAVRLDTASTQIEYTYETANFYVPYVEADNYRGYQEKIYSDHLVSVIPELEKRVRVGLSLPTAANPTGDYIKAVNIGSFNYDLFDSDSGDVFVQGELDRIADLGCNMIIFDDFWFHDQETSSVHEPIYGDPWPACWTGTLPVDALVKLVDWVHERGMTFCYRYMLRQKGDHSGVARANYSPTDSERYISTQIQQKTAYARLFETLGVELFCLEAENEYFTRMDEVADLIQEVRAVYGGYLTNGAYSVQSNLACPYAGDLDLLSWSDYYFLANPPSESDTAERLTASYLYHYSSDIQFVLEHLGMVGMPIEVGVDTEGVEVSAVELQYLGYLDAFEALQGSGAPVCGIGWWAWTFFRPQLPNYVVSGHPAEEVLRDYFKNTLSDTLALRFERDDLRYPDVDQLLEAFEAGLPRLEYWWQGSRITTDLVGGSPLNDTCLRFTLKPEGSPDYRLGFIWRPFDRPMDWSAFTSLNFWLKSANDNWGVEVSILDADGDLVKFRSQTWPSALNSTLELGGWRFISIPLSLFTNPPGDGRGNESMDWRNVERWGLGIFYKEHGTQTLWLDQLYLSKEGDLNRPLISRTAEQSLPPDLQAASSPPELDDWRAGCGIGEVLILDDFEDGNLDSPLGATWKRLSTPLGIGSDSHGTYLEIDLPSDAGGAVHIPMQRRDVSAMDGVFIVWSASDDLPIDLKLDCSVSGQSEQFVSAHFETGISAAGTLERLLVPFSEFRIRDTGDSVVPYLEWFFNLAILPDRGPGRIHIHELGFYKQLLGSVAAPSDPEVVPPEPHFVVSQDVTQDSVVQIGSGPQELSTDIKFYPNTCRVSPGDTVYWTLDLGDLDGPFSVQADMDNDEVFETTIRTDASSIEIPVRYTKPNVYIPQVIVRDGKGVKWTAYPTTMAEVLAELQPRQRLGIDLPTLEDPAGDTVKGAVLRVFGASDFGSAGPSDYVLDRIYEWVDDGINLVVLCFWWYAESPSSVVHAPVYRAIWNTHGAGTFPMDVAISLTDLLHAAGIRVAWRYEVMGEGKDGCAMRLTYSPSDPQAFYEYQSQVKVYYARLAEQLGVEMFGLDMENPFFSLDPRSLEIVEQVRSVYSGIIFNEERADDSLAFQSPLNDVCDVIFLSVGPDNFDSLKESPVTELRRAFETQYRHQIMSLLYEYAKPGMFEIFVDHDPAHPEYQSAAYSAILSVLVDFPGLVIGNTFHETVLKSGFDSMYDPIGRPAEQVLRRYYTEVLSEQREYDFLSTPDPPARLRTIADFEAVSSAAAFYTTNAGGTSILTRDSSAPCEGRYTLHVHTDSTNTPGAFAFYMLRQDFPSPQDWRSFDTINFWMRNRANPTSLLVSLYDSDGDRFLAQLKIQYPEEGTWMLYSVSFRNLFHPDWAEEGNGVLDLGHVQAFSVLEMFSDGHDHDTWFDSFYLGGPL